MLSDLEDSGVDISQVAIKDGVPTGRVMGLVDHQGRRSLYVEPGANNCLAQSDITLETITHARMVHLASFVGSDQLALQEWLTERSLVAHHTSCLTHSASATALSFAPGQIYARLGRDRLVKILQHTAILFVTEMEAEQLGGVGLLRACGCAVVAETLGSRGSRITHDGGSFCSPAFPAAVVDTTGAGDAFAAGFLFGWLRGKPLDTCARWGNRAASQVIQAPGANSDLPTSEELEAIS
jgi:ribokinase